jgi:hypothetical protein
MPRTNLTSLLLLSGLCLVAVGYSRLAVPPDALYDEVLARVREGVLSVVAGGGLLMAWLTQR